MCKGNHFPSRINDAHYSVIHGRWLKTCFWKRLSVNRFFRSQIRSVDWLLIKHKPRGNRTYVGSQPPAALELGAANRPSKHFGRSWKCFCRICFMPCIVTKWFFQKNLKISTWNQTHQNRSESMTIFHWSPTAVIRRLFNCLDNFWANAQLFKCTHCPDLQGIRPTTNRALKYTGQDAFLKTSQILKEPKK